MILNVMNAVKSQLVSINVATTKTVYNYGEEIDKSTITVTAIYRSGSMREVSYFSVSPFTAIDSTVTVTYRENGVAASASFSITVLRLLERIVSVPDAAEYEYAEAVGATTTAFYSDGTQTVVAGTLSPTSAIATNINVSYTESGVTKTYAMPINVYPSNSQFAGGEADIENEGNGDWTMYCRASGTLNLRLPYSVDVWCVGGGGGGGGCACNVYNNRAAGGGGGGYVAGANAQSLSENTTYNIVVGGGGAGGSNSTSGNDRNISGRGGTGSQSSAFSIVANGGQGGVTVNTNNSSTQEQLYAGGNGGSGGGGLMVDGSNAAGAGGSNGSNGSKRRPGLGGLIPTNDFGEPSNTVRAGGGGGGSYGTASAAPGGSGGGNGGSQGGTTTGSPGIANYGGGGGGGAYAYSGSWYAGYPGGAGSSGIVIIRSHRDVNINKFKYSYTGIASYLQETNDDWNLEITGSGTLTVNETTSVDIYMIGGGQGGYLGGSTSYGSTGNTYYPGGAGGQGGYVTIKSNVTLQPGSHLLTIGQGGATGNGNIGGTTMFGSLYDAPGGGSNPTGTYQGGALGGTAGEVSGSGVPTRGGTGGNSAVADFNGNYRGGGGSGGYSAREDQYHHWDYNWVLNSGGSEGGGISMTALNQGGRNPTPNYGGGGSGGCNGNGGYGGSGVIIIRNHRSA